ncbi:MAG TPA: DUF6717 family protein [Chitinophagaceae bacterium]|nr:DUF6717 family protein [Chitinophagaceae bacterium]
MIKYKTTESLHTSYLVKIFSFIKEDGSWFIDLPMYLLDGGKKSDLEMLEGAAELLQMMARGKNKVSMIIDNEPFDGADILDLIELCDAPKGGGYYKMHTCRGRKVNKEIWLRDVTLFVFGDMPQKIYVKTLSDNRI